MTIGSLEDAKKATTIAVFGVGNGFYFDSLKGWLEASVNHQLVFFEEDPAAIESRVAKSIQKHPQVHVSTLHDQASYAILSPDFYFLSEKDAGDVYLRLLQDVYTVHAYLAELWFYQEQTNIYYHLAHLDEYIPSKDLEGSLFNSHFTICGAGPTLEEHLSALKDQKGLLIGAGTALNLLNDFGIQTNLGVVFDSKPTGARRLQSNSAFSIPFLVDLDSIKGVQYLSGKKLLTKQAGLAPWKEKLLSKLLILDLCMEVGTSISSTHYAIEAAIKLGASEITLLGVDLAYIKGKQYAGAKTWLLDEENPVPLSERKDLIFLNQSHLASRLFLKEAEIFSNLSRIHPNVTFKKAIEKKTESTRFEIKQSKFKIPLKTIQNVLMEWRQELIDSPDLLLEGYVKRLELKFAAKKRWMKPSDVQNAIDQFCKQVLDHHLHKIDEALFEVEEKMAFPDSSQPSDEVDLDGTVKLYYGNGQLKSFIEYKEAKRNGIYRFYSRSGKLLEEGFYSNGFPIGRYREWNRRGYLEKEIFSHPNGLFDLTEWDETGKIIKEVKSGHRFMKEVDALKESLEKLLKELP